MDVIIVQPVDPDAIEEVCKEALDSDIEVVCWDEKMENSSFNWVIENYDLGVEIGTQAAAPTKNDMQCVFRPRCKAPDR